MLELRSVSTFWNDATARARAGLGGIGQRSGIVGIILPYSLTTTSPSSCRCKPQDHAEINAAYTKHVRNPDFFVNGVPSVSVALFVILRCLNIAVGDEERGKFLGDAT